MLVVSAGLALSVWSSALAQVKAEQPKLDPKVSAQPNPMPTKAMPGAQTPTPSIDPSQPHPQINFDKTSNDFGVIDDDHPVSTEFKFSNTGTTMLNIAETKGSCGCTVPALEKKDYAPGEGGVIKVTYNPHGRRGKQQTTVTVTCNDPLKPSQILELHSEIKPLMMLEPQVASLNQVPKGKATTTTVMVTSREKDLTPTQVTSSSPAVTAKLGETKDAVVDGETVKQTPIEITTVPAAEVGPINGQLSIRTSDPARLLNLTLTGEIIGDVNVQPKPVALSAVEPGSSINQVVKLTSRSNKPFKVEKVEEQASGSSKMFTIAVAEDKSVTPSAWNLTLTGQAPQSGAFRGDLVVTTDLPDEKTVKVQYYGFVRNAQPAQPGFIGDAWTANPSLLQR